MNWFANLNLPLSNDMTFMVESQFGLVYGRNFSSSQKQCNEKSIIWKAMILHTMQWYLYS